MGLPRAEAAARRTAGTHVSVPLRDRAKVHPETVEQWRAWLAETSATSDGVWLVSWKTATGRPHLSYDEAVTEALAWGWVDSRAGTLDDERSTLWYAPRKPGSGAGPGPARCASSGCWPTAACSPPARR